MRSAAGLDCRGVGLDVCSRARGLPGRRNAVLSEQERLAPESRAHGRARSAALDRLSQHFSRVELRVYLASNMAVHYPGERVFVPDVLAVLDVEDPCDDDERLAWVVAEEGRGLDLVLEVSDHEIRTKVPESDVTRRGLFAGRRTYSPG